ncbi:MAG: response regulator transcription factor [Propionibacteriaceae bacterium]|nr:response regulator transcription factor [Micropruina sp.]HBX80985.1 GlnR family transcriptional regulator [Propionibacteriaceae bacterium]HBY21980.1 GlnR family transcriptional regulator [Propionibacteriaceae bacterium]
MASLLVVGPDLTTMVPATLPLPVLGLLAHDVHYCPADATALTESARVDIVLLDGRVDLASARSMCRLFAASGATVPLLLVVSEGGFTALTAEWGISDVVLATAGPAELDARIRLLASAKPDDGIISAGGITIDESAYSAVLHGASLDLTYTEFELLKYLVQHPGRVFSREQLLSEIWGYDYFGGTRTVDVHIRRLRAKLGTEHESLIGTVRNVGYRFSAS